MAAPFSTARASSARASTAPPAGGPPRAGRPPDRRSGPAAALLLFLTAAAYLPALRGGFVWDDETVLNRFVKSPDGLRQFWLTTQTPDYWPVTSSTFWLEWRLWGANPLGYHLTNLLLHLAGVLLLWVVLRRLRLPGAWLAALLFAVHPVNVESVAWITQRKNLVALVFYLASIYAFVRWRERRDEPARPPEERRGPPAPPAGNGGAALWYSLSLLAFVLALLGKASVAILPLVLLGLLAWNRRLGWRDLGRVGPFFFAAGALTLVNLWFQKHNLAAAETVRNAGGLERVLGAGAVVWFYLSKALLPIHLMLFYPAWQIRAANPLWWLPLGAALGLTVILYYKGQEGRDGRPARPSSLWRCALFAWAYYCVALIPVMGFTDVYFMKFSLVADHYQHLALIGLAALAAAAWDRWRRQSAAAAGTAAAVVVGLLFCLTWRQCLVYRDAATLLENSLRRNPDSALVHNNLGVVWAEAHRLPEAAAEFDQALRLDPAYADAQHNAGLTLAREGRWAEAIPHYDAALRIQPTFTDAQDDWGNALLWLGRPAEAIPHYERAIELNPGDAEAQCNVAIALGRLGRPAEAIPHYEAALRLEPDNAAVHLNLASVLMAENRIPEAIRQFEETLRLRPEAADVRAALAHAREMLPPPGP